MEAPRSPRAGFRANFSRSNSIYDKVGHGTHVAGTIAARQDGRGVVGWAPKCSLGVCKVLGDDSSGGDAGIAAGIRYAADNGAHIINLSLGGGFSRAVHEACLDAIQAGVFVICAAGNEGAIDGINTIGYPAPTQRNTRDRLLPQGRHDLRILVPRTGGRYRISR